MERLVLVDGHAILHRAYHALPPLTTSKGELVNAVFGFTSMILKIKDELSPSYLVVCFDLPAPTFRNKLFADYQAQRPKMADELAGQIEKVKKLIKAMGIPIFEKEGYEADDLIGTLAKKSQNLETIIVTGDRDILQLVDQNTRVYMLVRGLTEAIFYDQEMVRKKIGLKPEQIPDYKALVGDLSDNYPGVCGVGPKTAIKLLQEYGSLENLYQGIESLKQKNGQDLKRKLIEGREQAFLGKKLATILTQVPVEFDLEKARLKDFDNPKVKKMFAEFEFKSLLLRLEKKEKEDKKKIEKNQNQQLSLV